MTAPPSASNEYSTQAGASEGVSDASDAPAAPRPGRVSAPPFGRLGAGLFAGAFLAAIMLVAAEFTTLYTLRSEGYHVPATSVTTGSHDSYALIPIALLVVVLAFSVLRSGSRAALAAVGLAGLVALLIALLGDLPDTHASGLVGCVTGQCVPVVTRAAVGMYLETLGAVVLIATAGCGLALLWRPQPRRDAPA